MLCVCGYSETALRYLSHCFEEEKKKSLLLTLFIICLFTNEVLLSTVVLPGPSE